MSTEEPLIQQTPSEETATTSTQSVSTGKGHSWLWVVLSLVIAVIAIIVAVISEARTNTLSRDLDALKSNHDQLQSSYYDIADKTNTLMATSQNSVNATQLNQHVQAVQDNIDMKMVQLSVDFENKLKTSETLMDGKLKSFENEVNDEQGILVNKVSKLDTTLSAVTGRTVKDIKTVSKLVEAGGSTWISCPYNYVVVSCLAADGAKGSFAEIYDSCSCACQFGHNTSTGDEPSACYAVCLLIDSMSDVTANCISRH